MQLSLLTLNQNIGQYRKRMAFFNDPSHRLQRLEQCVAFKLYKLHDVYIKVVRLIEGDVSVDNRETAFITNEEMKLMLCKWCWRCVDEMWVNIGVASSLGDIHILSMRYQLCRTFSKELKSRVNSLLVDLSREIFLHACNTVV